ncbi:MAG: hypothetical protein GY937_20080 [bacterium]|nr:hypothetical protein [bacterium]
MSDKEETSNAKFIRLPLEGCWLQFNEESAKDFKACVKNQYKARGEKVLVRVIKRTVKGFGAERDVWMVIARRNEE